MRTPSGASTRLEITRVEAYPGCDFPHLLGVVLRTPPSEPLPDGWSSHRHIRYTDGTRNELLYRMPALVCAVRNLSMSETRTYDVPVADDQLAGLLFGSLTTKAWIDDGQDVHWLNDHDNQPGLFDFADQIGTDPAVRVFDVDTAGPTLQIAERETVRLTELADEDR